MISFELPREAVTTNKEILGSIPDQAQKIIFTIK